METLEKTKPLTKNYREVIYEVNNFIGFATTDSQKNSAMTKSVTNVSENDLRKLAEWYDAHLHEPDNDSDYFFIIMARKNYSVLITTRKS